MENDLAFEMSCSFKKLDDEQSPPKKIVSLNFSHAVFSLLNFLMYDDGADRLS